MTIKEQINAAGNRMNVGKTKWTLTLRRMWPALREVARVTEMGAKKYSPDGWWNNELAEDDTCDAIVRHTMAVLSDIYIDANGDMHVGQNDPESGLPHWAHAAWNCLALGALRIKGANREKIEAAK